tara:strand:+ start:974 stop:1228 length:255 start_codon:yes stop_codon:yes gene_type:complete
MKNENMKNSKTTGEVTKEICDHLTYSSMCYTYADLRGSRCHARASFVLYKLFGDLWMEQVDGIHEWYEQTSITHRVRGLDVCKV